MIRDRLYLLPERPRAGKNHFLNTFEPKIENESAMPNRPSSNVGKVWKRCHFIGLKGILSLGILRQTPCSQGWPGAHWLRVKDDLELLVVLPPPLECWGYRPARHHFGLDRGINPRVSGALSPWHSLRI